jgi:outer membrane protein OmpA-like peptidoglycan-associated protein
MKTFAVLAAGLVIAFSPDKVAAQDLSTEQIIEMLRPPASSRSLGKTRGIAIENGEVTEKTSPTVNLYVNFEYKSADLEQDARIVLDRLAAALKDDRLVEWEFLIGGHTDAVGSDAYNLALSERRALSVKRYLTQTHGISEQRLIEKGFGEKRLLDPNYPEDGVNRRVQITTLAVPPQ